ncbi:MAG: hypothetical protein M1814_001329 [Vezdaea aestivalis]|nr:MAG: hypothetical protein M1814_001329 [Vezdaea aestivalis]
MDKGNKAPKGSRRRKRGTDTLPLPDNRQDLILSQRPQWDSTTFRVTNIPVEFDSKKLQQVITSLFKLQDKSWVKVHSLASDATDPENRPTRVATVSFREMPQELGTTSTPAEAKAFDFSLENSQADEDDQRLDFDSHFHDFTPLSPVGGDDLHKIDCIVLHGWGGHAFGSFKSHKESESHYMWLRDSLPQRCPSLRVRLYGYGSKLHETNTNTGIYDYAASFRDKLRTLRRQTKKNGTLTPLIFIVHSLGGLILMDRNKAIVQMKESKREDDHLNVQTVYGALFFGVPGQGMNVDATASMVGDFPSRYTLNLLDQRLGSRLRLRQFAKFCEALPQSDSKIVSFFEEQRSPTMRQDPGTLEWSKTGPLAFLVSPSSAVCGRAWENNDDFVKSIDANHYTLVRFARNDRGDYLKVIETIHEFAQVAPSVIEARVAKSSLYYSEINDRRNRIADAARGTCLWLQTHPNYIDWLSQPHGLLWVRGHPGAGKSTLMRYASEAAELQGGWLLISFFFHGSGSEIQRSPLGLLRSLLHQLLPQTPDLLRDFNSIYQRRCDTEGQFEEKWKWDVSELKKFIKHHVMQSSQRYQIRAYIDGLDECGTEAALGLIEFFDTITASSTDNQEPNTSLSICFSCRHFPIIALERGSEICIDSEVYQDICTFARNETQRWFRNKIHAREVQSTIENRKSGTFQLAKLIIFEARRLSIDGAPLKKIQSTLQKLPTDLSNLYASLLNTIDDGERAQSLRLLKWLSFAKRPLTLSELRYGIIIDVHAPQNSIKEYEQREDFIETAAEMTSNVIHLSRGLAEVGGTGEQQYVQLIHQTVLEHLLQVGIGNLARLPNEHVRGLAHLELANICLRYMAMEEITNDDIEPLFDFDGDPDLKLADEHPLLEYAVLFWVPHIRVVDKEGLQQSYLPDVFGKSSNKLLDQWEMLHTRFDSYESICIGSSSLLHIAVANNIPNLARGLLQFPHCELDSVDSWGRSLLASAATIGDCSMVQLLLKQDGVEADEECPSGQTPLSHAAESGHTDIVQLLVNKPNVEADWKDYSGRTPLSHAAESGHIGVVELLIKRHDVNGDWKNVNGQTPLSLAAAHGHTDIVELLIDPRHELKIDSKDTNGQTPLSHAAAKAFADVVKLLVKRSDVEADSKDREGRTPLSHACLEATYEDAEGLEVVQLLLQRSDVDINSRDKKGRTALSHAAQVGREQIVLYLMGQNHVEIDTKDEDGLTPLLHAQKEEHEDVVQTLQQACYPKSQS